MKSMGLEFGDSVGAVKDSVGWSRIVLTSSVVPRQQ